MKKLGLAMICGSLLYMSASVAGATTVDWDVVTGDATVSGSILTINRDNSWHQAQGLHGAGFMASGPTIDLSVDLWTWDSYSANKGWYDVFVVNMNQTGYVLDDAWIDPITAADYEGGDVTDILNLAGTSLAWGGTSWTDRQKESLFGDMTLSLSDYDASKEIYISIFWKTDKDSLFGSGGTITVSNNDVAPVPEPATMLLFGIGLAGLAGVSRRKKA